MEGLLWLSLVLLPLVAGVTEVSRALLDYRMIVQQVQLTARYLSTQEPGSGHAQARCLFLTGYPASDCRQAPLREGFGTAGFELLIQDATNSPLHRAQRAGTAAPAGGLVNLVTVTARGYRHRLVFIPEGAVAQAAALGFAPIAATYRQMD